MITALRQGSQSTRRKKTDNGVGRVQRIKTWRADRNPEQAIKAKLPQWSHGLGLSATALNVLGMVHASAFRYGMGNITNELIAKRLDRHVGSVSRVITECQRKGAILPIYLWRTDADGKLRLKRFLLTCCLRCVQLLKDLPETDWGDMTFSPGSGANPREVLGGARTFVERCEELTGAHIGRLRHELSMEVGTDEIILDLAAHETAFMEKRKAGLKVALFQSEQCEGGLNENVNICIHSDFQSELNKESNAAGGVDSPSIPLPIPQAQPIPLSPETSPGPSAEHPEPNPPVAPTPLPEAKKRGGGKFEADHPGVMARIRALCQGDTVASWDATYTRAVQAFAKSWDAPNGPNEQALALLEAHLPARRRAKLTLASLAYAEAHQDRTRETRRSFWATPLHAAALAVSDAWDALKTSTVVFEAGRLKGGEHVHQLMMADLSPFVACLEKHADYATLIELAAPQDIGYTRACLYLARWQQMDRLQALHARYADHIETLLLADWHHLLPLVANTTFENVEIYFGISTARVLELIRSHYENLRTAVAANYPHVWTRYDERTSVEPESYSEALENFDERMESVVPLNALTELQNMLKAMNY